MAASAVLVSFAPRSLPCVLVRSGNELMSTLPACEVVEVARFEYDPGVGGLVGLILSTPASASPVLLAAAGHTSSWS